MIRHRCDVIVVGGGLVVLAAAATQGLVAVRAGRRIKVLSRSELERMLRRLGWRRRRVCSRRGQSRVCVGLGSATASRLQGRGVVGWCVVVEAELAGFLGQLVQRGSALHPAALLEVDEVLEPDPAETKRARSRSWSGSRTTCSRRSARCGSSRHPRPAAGDLAPRHKGFDCLSDRERSRPRSR
jgi:hypothetical protein